jgi:hypothetical protein
LSLERWQAFDPEERRALADALRWRASQLRTYVALADAMAGTVGDEVEEAELADAEVSDAESLLALLERLLAELTTE